MTGMRKLIIFDMDGLMFDTESVAARAYLEVGSAKGLRVSMDKYRRVIGLEAKAIWARYREDFGDAVDPEQLYREVGARIGKITRTEGLPVKPGLFELLDVLDARGIPKVVASGSDLPVIQSNLEHAGILDRFAMIISSDAFARGKPSPDIFLACCQRMGVSPEDALVLEDAPSGIQAAIAGGIPVVAVPDILEIPASLAEQCLAIAADLTEVIPCL